MTKSSYHSCQQKDYKKVVTLINNLILETDAAILKHMLFVDQDIIPYVKALNSKPMKKTEWQSVLMLMM